MRFALAIAAAIFLAPLPAQAAEGVVAGRLELRAAGAPVSLRAVRESLRDSVSLEMRSGALVITAVIDPDGYFVAKGPAGTYRLEYLNVGPRAEFFAPHVIEIREGQLVCAGTVQLEVAAIEALGANGDNSVRVADDCRDALPRIRRLASASSVSETIALAGPAPTVEHPGGKDWIELLMGLRAEVGYWEPSASVRGTYVLGINGDIGDTGTFLLHGSGAYGSTLAGTGWEATAGLGYTVFTLLEVHAFAGFRQASGLMFGGAARLGNYPLGLGLRVDLSPSGVTTVFTFDVAPFVFVGALL